jgi:hypothetical protein
MSNLSISQQIIQKLIKEFKTESSQSFDDFLILVDEINKELQSYNKFEKKIILQSLSTN